MTGGVLSKLEVATDEMPAKKEIAIALIRAGAIGFLTFYLVRWALRHADPTYQQKQKAKTKAKEMMERLGVRNVRLNEHEVMIASHLIDPKNLKVSWADVAGLDDVIEQLKKTVIYPVLAQQKGIVVSRLVQPPKGVLLYGPPGCGKTLIAKAMAKEAKCWFINLDVSVLTDKWYGESQKLTGAVFSLAEKIQPCIIFIDEIDSLLRIRASQDHEVTAMMKAQFMSLWDGLITDPKKTVIVMGATNRPRDMDSAILRRMATKFHVPAPDLEQRKHILNLTLKNERLASDYSLDKLAALTDGFSGSDLKEIARSAAVSCLSDLQLSRDGLNLTTSTSLDETEQIQGGHDSWFQRMSPWGNTSKSGRKGSLPGSTDPGPSMQRAISLRAISFKDLEAAVNKAKESKAHCTGASALKYRLDLD